MNLAGAFGLAAAVLGAVLGMVVVATVVIKAYRRRSTRRRDALASELRPRILASLDEQEGFVAPRRGAERRVFQLIVTSLLTKTRGADRRALADLLERNGDLDRARRALRSRRAGRRRAAAELLGAAGDPASVQPILATLDDRNRLVRLAGARALGRIGSPDGVEPLIAAGLSGRLPLSAVTMAVVRIGPSAAPVLRPMLESDLPTARIVAAQLIGYFGDISARGRLEQAIRDGGPEAAAAVEALGRLSLPTSAPLLIERLRSELDKSAATADLEQMVTLVEALGRIGDRRAIPTLTETLGRQRRLSLAASTALAGMGQRRSLRSIAERERSNGTLGADDSASAVDGIRR